MRMRMRVSVMVMHSIMSMHVHSTIVTTERGCCLCQQAQRAPSRRLPAGVFVRG